MAKLTIELFRIALMEPGSQITLAQDVSVGAKPAKGMTAAGLKVSVRPLIEFTTAHKNGTSTQIDAMISAANAGEFGVPVVLVSGGNQMIAEVHRTIDPGITGVAVKRDIGFHSAESLSPQEAQALAKRLSGGS